MPLSNDWESEWREYFTKALRPKKATLGNLDLELTVNFIKKLLLSQKQELAEKLMEISVMKNDPHLGFLIRRDTMLALLQEPSSDTGL